MTTPDYATTTLKAAQANTLASITQEVVDLNNNLTSNYLAAFSNWLLSYTARPYQRQEHRSAAAQRLCGGLF
jgi:hypothetical protein